MVTITDDDAAEACQILEKIVDTVRDNGTGANHCLIASDWLRLRVRVGACSIRLVDSVSELLSRTSGD